jgi:hypothetical protein
MLSSTTTTPPPPHHNNNITIIIINNNNKRQKWKSRERNNNEFNATQGSFYFYFLGGLWDLGNCPQKFRRPLSLFWGRERERERESKREREREGGEADVVFVWVLSHDRYFYNRKKKHSFFFVGVGWFGWFHKIPKSHKKTKEVGGELKKANASAVASQIPLFLLLQCQVSVCLSVCLSLSLSLTVPTGDSSNAMHQMNINK